MRFKDNRGFTLMEIIITMGLIALAIGLSTFGLNVIFNSNVQGYANDLVSDIRFTSTREMAASEHDYKLVLYYDTSSSKYKADSIVYYNGGATPTTLKTITFPKGFEIQKASSLIDGSTPHSDTTFEFDPSSGAITSDGHGTYTIRAANSTLSRKMIAIKESGRVYIE